MRPWRDGLQVDGASVLEALVGVPASRSGDADERIVAVLLGRPLETLALGLDRDGGEKGEKKRSKHCDSGVTPMLGVLIKTPDGWRFL